MRLEEAIVVLQWNCGDSHAKPVVLRVKYPEGSDPVTRMRQAVTGFLAARSTGSEAAEAGCLSWGQALSCLSSWDWAAQELYVQALYAPASLNYVECPDCGKEVGFPQVRGSLAEVGTIDTTATRVLAI